MQALSLIDFTPAQRMAAEEALSLPEAPVYDEAGNLQPMAALADLLRRVPWLADQYAAHGIDEQVLRDTLTDIPIWMETCYRRTGEWGMLEYAWLDNHLSMRLFRVGRLQYILGQSRVPGYAYRGPAGEIATLLQDGWSQLADGSVRGIPVSREGFADAAPITMGPDWQCILRPVDPVLDVHIPEGMPLKVEDAKASLARASGFFRRHLQSGPLHAFVCESWMLDWALPQIVPGSNLAHFQQLFYCVPWAESSDRQMLERVYGPGIQRPQDGPQNTSLQRAITLWYDQGKRCRDAYGYIPIQQGGA